MGKMIVYVYLTETFNSLAIRRATATGTRATTRGRRYGYLM